MTSLDHTIREGNSVISDLAVHPKAFDWQGAFPEVFAQGGFDVVVGNPPYIRQELLTPYKPWLEAHYEVFHGMADLYVYFYELGVRMLKPGGLLSFVVTNKWMKAGYGEPLRRFFSEKAWVKSVVDLGHAKQIFEEVDVFPSIIVVEKPTAAPKPKTARLCTIPREQLRIDNLSVQIEQEGFEISEGRLGKAPWNLESSSVTDLLEKIRSNGIPLKEFAGLKPLYGIKTGLNEAFLISEDTRNRLVAEDRTSEQVVRPYLRGQDVGRWVPEWQRLWMIFTRRGTDIDQFPAVRNYLMGLKDRLEPRPRDWGGGLWPGRKAGNYKWFEIQDPVSYWQAFLRPKLCIQRIAFHSRVARDDSGMLLNDAAIILPTTDSWILACLNSPAMWFFSFRFFPHKKDEALAMDIPYVERLPVPKPSDSIRAATETAVQCLIEITSHQQQTQRTLLDWLRVEYVLEKPSNKLLTLAELDSDTWVSEVKRIRGKKQPLSAAGLHALRAEYTRTLVPARALAAETLTLERTLSDLVNQAYGLTPAEIALMWQTAPPRMPIPPPG